MTKRSRTVIIAIMILVAIALYFIAGTYARYTTDFNGEGTVQAAKWNVALKDGGNADSTKVELTLTPEENEYVAKDRIAPNSTVKGEVTVNLEGTEVAVDLTAKIDDAQKETIASELGIEAEDLTISVEATGAGAAGAGTGGVHTIALPDQKAFTAENGTVTVTVKITWQNQEEHNTQDTAAGKAGKSAKVPIILTAQQHIEE